MKLHDLSLADLSAFHDFLGTLRKAGKAMEDSGYGVRFDMTPGCVVSIWTDFVMPDDVGGEDLPPDTSGAEWDPEPEESGLPAPQPVRTPEPPYSLPPASGPGWRTGEPWSEDEDEALIAACVANPDWTMGAIARAVSKPMRRTVAATAFRLSHGLRARVIAARAQAPGTGRTVPVEAPAGGGTDATGGAVPAPIEPAAPMQAPPKAKVAAERPAEAAVAAPADVGHPLPAQTSQDAVKPAPAVDSSPAAGVVAIEAGLPTWQRQLRAHLNAVGYAEPWSKEKDLLLVEGLLKGMGVTGAAEFAGVDGTTALKRWQVLTDPLPKDAKGRPMMEWQQRLLIELRARCDVQVAA